MWRQMKNSNTPNAAENTIAPIRAMCAEACGCAPIKLTIGSQNSSPKIGRIKVAVLDSVCIIEV